MEQPELGNLFFDQIRQHGQSILISDYEGTLASFSEEEEKDVPLARTIERLERLLSLGCRIVIFSDMPAARAKELLGIKNGLEIWGSCGTERIGVNGDVTSPGIDLRQAEGLHQAKEQALKLTSSERVSSAGSFVKVDLENMQESEKGQVCAELEQLWQGIETRYDLKRLSSDNCTSLIARGFDKASMVREIIDPLQSWSCCYLGDDLSDEEAFNTVWGRGISARVNRNYRESAAQIWLSPPGELHLFLDQWIWALQTRSSDCRD